MSMPLPLELAKPVLLAGDLDTQVRTQLCGGTRTNENSQSYNAFAGITVDAVDVAIDDNDVL